MKVRFAVIMLVIIMLFTLSACGEAEETTLAGLVVSVDGGVITVAEKELGDMETMDFGNGEMPEMPEGMENFGQFEGFDPSQMPAGIPEGAERPEWGSGEMPEGMTPPENMEMPEGMTPPENMEMPEGMTLPEGMEKPDFEGASENMRPGFEEFESDLETKEIDISEAHISLEVDGVKESGNISDIVPGSYVTVTIDGKGKATYVLVSSSSFFAGMDMPNL